MTDKPSFDPERMMDNLYWWGIPTLFNCPHVQNPADVDVALVGVPHSTGNGTTERDQHLGPRAVRNVSKLARRVHAKFGFAPWDECRIGDLGDVPLPEANDNEACIERITAFYREIDAAGVTPVSIGGDHSITGGILQALGGAASNIAGGRKVALLHLDAHTDAFEHLVHFLGAYKSAAHWASYLVRQGNVDPTQSVQIGLRGNPRTLDWLQPSRDLGYEIITMEDFQERGLAACCKTINERIGDAPLYITFDLDCLDPSVAPAVSNLEPGEAGFYMNEAMALLRSVRGKNIIGGDVVCLMPTKDLPNNVTSLVAASVMFELISLIVDSRF